MSRAVVWFGWPVRCWAGVRGAVLAVATVEGCFLLLFLCTVSSVTGQCEGFSCGPVAVGASGPLWPLPGEHASPHPS